MGSKDKLENLVRSGGLKVEPPNRRECEGYMDVDEALLADLLAATDALLPQVQQAMAIAE